MRIAVTGATGFLGRYIVSRLTGSGHEVQAMYRKGGHSPYEAPRCRWVEADLSHTESFAPLLQSCDGAVHAALWREGQDWSGGSDLRRFLEINFLQTVQLIQVAQKAHVPKFVFVSTCAVHDRILGDRPLDETHPLYPKSHYGAHKAAIEAFVHSFAAVEGYDICAIRPTGIYGAADPVEDSKWYDLVKAVAEGREVHCAGGGKEVHASDVAKAIELLLASNATKGEVYSCYDRYISEREVADMAAGLSRSSAKIIGERTRPKHEIRTNKIRSLGMAFGGESLLKQTIGELLGH